MERVGIDIKLLLDTAMADHNVDKMNKAFRVLKKEVKSLNKELKFDPKNIEVLTQKFNNLKAQEKLALAVLKEYENTRDNLLKQGKFGGDEWNDVITNIEKAETDLYGVQSQISKCEEAIAKANDKWGAFEEYVGKVADGVGIIADKLEPLSKASGNFLKGATDGAIEFQDAFADVRKTVDTNEEGFAQISKDLREMATTLPTSASDLAHIAGLAGQMNVPAEQVAEFTKAMVDFGNSTDISAEQATQDIAQIYNVIGRGGDFSNVENLLSAIVELGNNSATTESKIVEMFRNISAGASRVGQTEAQMVALASTLSSLGLDKGGASAISKIMTRIDMAVTQGGEDLSAWAEIAGMSGETFQKAWSQDSANVLLQIVKSMSTMSDEGISMNQILSDLDISEIRQVDTISRLANANEEYAKNLKLANNAYQDGTALSEEASKRYDTVASKIQILKNNLMEFALSIGDILLPYVDWFVQSLHELTDWLNNLSPHTKQLIARVAMVMAVATPLLRIVQTGLGALANLRTALMFIKTILGLLGGGIVDLVTKIATMILSMGNWFYIIGVVVGAVILLYNNCDWFRELVNKIIARIQALWDKFKQTNWIETLGEKFGWFGEIIGGLIELVKTLVGWFGDLIDKALEFLGLKQSVEESTGFIGKLFGGRGNDQIQSGGFSSGGALTLNANFTVNSSTSVTRQDVRSWSKWLADDINEELGRRM